MTETETVEQTETEARQELYEQFLALDFEGEFENEPLEGYED